LCMATRLEEIHKQLIAFYPVYTFEGSLTRIIYNETEQSSCCLTDHRQVETVKRVLARCYAVDLPAQARLLRDKYQRRIILHFYLPDGRVFVPFKLRESRIKGDACYGYVDIDQVARLLPGDKPQLLLKTGESLTLHSNISTARLAYFMALELLADYGHRETDSSLDLVNALAVLQGVLAGRTPACRQAPRRFRVKFLPCN